MSAERVSMHKIKEVLRLTYAVHLKQRQVAASLRMSQRVVSKYWHGSKTVSFGCQ